MSFLKSLNIGSDAENFVIDLLNSKSLQAKKLDGKKHDLSFIMDGIIYTAEVKHDKMSAKTGNIALEFYNSKSMKPSGFMSSTCNLWFHVLTYDDIWVTSTSFIREFTSSNKPKKTVYGGGDDNSDMLIYEKNLLNKFAKNIIIEDLIQCLKYYLK